jgi:signal transduction histidine kinase
VTPRLRQWLARLPQPTLGTLELRLFLVVVVGLLPLSLLAFGTLRQNADSQRQQLLDATAATMRAVMSAVDAEHSSSIAALDALAASPRLAAGDLAAFRAEAGDLMERRPRWVNVVLSTPQAQQLMNLRLPADSVLPRAVDAETTLATAQTGRPQVGNVVLSPVLQEHAFAVQVPVRERGGRVAYVLSAVIRPDAVLALLDRQRIPREGVVAIFDRSRHIVARSLNQAQAVGKLPSPGLVALLDGGASSGWGETRTLEGLPVYTVFQRSPSSGWGAAIGLPAHVVDESVKRSYWALGGSMLLSLLIGLLAAGGIGITITQPMQQLRRAANDVARGRAPALPTTTLTPLIEVGQALAAAHVEREKSLHLEREARVLEQAARRQAESASRTKDEFLAMLGHELRNPLAAIGQASQLLGRVEGGPALDGARAVIQRQVHHLGRMTDDLLDAGRVMLGKIALERRRVDLAAIVGHVLASLRHSHVLEGHELVVALQPAWVDGDATRLEQLAANLIVNAAKYTPPPGRIEVALRVEGAQAVLTVRDSGIGIEPELLPRVFELFVQGERSLERSQGGLGIGLTLVRRIAELHDGSVQAASAGSGAGSEFTLRLPLAAAGAPAAAAVPAGAPRALRVVLVEDNADVRTTLRALLELEGHSVSEAADGVAGLQTIVAARPDVVLVDVGLPLLDGYAVARAVRNTLGDGVRIIGVSGYGSQADRERGREAGMDGYLVKPVDPKALATLLSG